MKIRPSAFLKHVFSVVVDMVKAKSSAVKSKTSAFKTRLLFLGLLQNKKVFMRAINTKIHALISSLDKGQGSSGSNEDPNKAIVLYNAPKSTEEEALMSPTSYAEHVYYNGDDDDDNYPDLRHSLFNLEDEEDDELGNSTGSVIDLVRNSKEDGAEFSLEDEIDHVADVFIKRFHKQIRLQKLESFKRYQEMLQRGL